MLVVMMVMMMRVMMVMMMVTVMMMMMVMVMLMMMRMQMMTTRRSHGSHGCGTLYVPRKGFRRDMLDATCPCQVHRP